MIEVGDLFAFEEAEKLLDAFATGPRTAQFRRAYVKFKFMVHAYAYVDFCPKGRRPSRKELSYAWEDAQMAFVGHAEQGLVGAVIQLWVTLPTSDHELFAQVVKESFDRAEAATPDTVERRYLVRYRRKPVRLLKEGFDLPVITPVRGIQLRDWALDSGQDPDEVEEQWHWLELADRHILQEKTAPPPMKPKRKARLKLVEGK